LPLTTLKKKRYLLCTSEIMYDPIQDLLIETDEEDIFKEDRAACRLSY